MKKILLLISIILLISCITQHQEKIYLNSQLTKAMLIGKVITEEGLPLEEVTVKLTNLTETKTDISGRFFFKFIRYGRYTIYFEKKGYLPATYDLEYKFKDRKKQPFIKIKMFSTNYLVNEGFELLKEKRFKEAKEIIDKLENISLNEETVLYLKATYYYLISNLDEAVSILEKLKDIDRKNIYYQLTLFDIYEKVENFEQAAILAQYIAGNFTKEYYIFFKKAADLYREKLNNRDESERLMQLYNKYLNLYEKK